MALGGDRSKSSVLALLRLKPHPLAWSGGSVCCPGGSRLEVEGALAATLVHQRDAGHLSGSSCGAPLAASATSSDGGEL
jgi:hypothetical protein